MERKPFVSNNGNRMIRSFSCALTYKTLKQGTLYIYENCLEFSSMVDYNIIVPISDIKSIEKRTNAFIFDNSIALILE